MTSSSLFEDCQGLIEREQESWKSYFTKWEVLAKYEENAPENYFIEQSDVHIKHTGKQKEKRIPQPKKKKTLSVITYKKNQRNRKKVLKKKQINLKGVTQENMECYNNSRKQNHNEITENDILETNLRTFFRNFLKENQNKFEIFGVLSLAVSGSQESYFHNLFFNQKQALPCFDFQSDMEVHSYINQQPLVSKISNIIASNRLVRPIGNIQTEQFNRSVNFPKPYTQPLMESRNFRWNYNHALVDRCSSFEFSIENSLGHPYTSPKLKLHPEINLVKSRYPFLLKSSINRNLELKPFDWDFSQKSQVSLCRKINNEYFIKKTFPKMNITQDGKRFRNICLHKRTNSVSLSMENSNFTTLERKPLERKCFSENVLQRKRRCPSKLFFDNKEDSASDDQNENQASALHCQNKKLKTQIITEVLESDSDEYESIFDRVKKC